MTYASTILADNPQAWYRLGDLSGLVAVDSSGNGYNATLPSTGITYSQPGAIFGDSNTSMVFTSSATLSLPYNLNPSTWTALSLEFWVNTSGIWQYVVVTTSNSGTTTTYLNGIVYSSGSGDPVVIDTDIYYAGSPLSGNLDEIGLYNYVLTSTQVLNHYLVGLAASTFYASNVASTVSGLTLSDKMSTTTGGTETSVSVTMPSSGANLYVELASQGGTMSGTPVLPAPTGKGWSISSIAGSTILAGNWSAVFTLAKSGTSKTGASLLVRWYRRTMDGVHYPIGVSTLSSQSFTTSKTVYVTPTILSTLWQIIPTDTLYMDAFVYNGGSTAWASDVFTVYVSNSGSQGVANDGVIIAPPMITTPTGLSCYVGVPALQAGPNISVKNESFTLADAVDQRSVLTLTAEDPTAALSLTPNMPVVLADSTQGKLYDGYLAPDKQVRLAAGNLSPQTEHQLTFADHHRDFDKEANQTNYSNWTAGDIACDFIQRQQYKNGVWGEFAIESDYTPATFGAGTLSGTVATSTTSPFVYAPNTLVPPVTTNTGDLELTRAGTQFSLTESVTSDFSTGTLTNMVASGNALSPTTQSAIKMSAELPLAATLNIAETSSYTQSGGYFSVGEFFGTWAYAQIWAGSKVIGSNDTFNYDIWISSTSPAILAGMDFLCSDGTQFTLQNGNVDVNGSTGIFDQNNLSVDVLTDLSAYAKDAWFTRNFSIGSLAGKTITAVYVIITGSAAGYYTTYVKNVYLGSASGSPFFSTTATATQVNPPSTATGGGYTDSAVFTSVVQAYQPATSYRISPAHSISGVGLVQDSNITWTASLPANGPSVSTATSPYVTTTTIPPTNTSPSLVLLASYDGVTWLPCANNKPLPGLPAGANVSGLSLYLKESFAAGSDPSAIPSLLQVNAIINSAAAQTTTDVVAAYGNATEWNSGTYSGTGLNSNNQLTLGTYTRDWSDHGTGGQVFSYTYVVGSATQSASTGTYVMTVTPSGTTWAAAALSRLDFVGNIQNFTVEFDFSLSSINANVYASFVYRGQGQMNPITTTGGGGPVGGPCFSSGYALSFSNSHVVFNPFSGGNIFLNAFSSTSNPFISVSQSMSANTTYHVKIVVNGTRHTLYWNHATSPLFDVTDNATTSAGGVGFLGWTFNGTSTQTFKFDNLTVTPIATSTWTSPSISLSSLGTCGNTQIVWNEEAPTGATQSTALVSASFDGGFSWQLCTNGATIPGLTSGTNVSGQDLLIQAVLYSDGNTLTTPIITGLYVRVCGSYGTVTGTRISPVLNLTPVGYVASSNVAYHANIPTNTSVTVQTTQDLSTYHTVGNSGAGEALPYWTNQPSATQDVFNAVSSANYISTSKSGGSVATATYDTSNSRVTLSGGSGALYLNNSISATDVDLLVDMDESDAGGLCWREVSTSNYYELGVYDASSSGGFTNQLRLYKVASGTRSLLGSASSVTFTRGTFHRIRVTMQSGLINIYWDGSCVQSYLDTSPLGAGACGLRNDGGTSRVYQLWIQPLGTNLSGQALYTKVTMSTSDPQYMPQLFTLVCCVRGPSIGTGATVAPLHPLTRPFASYYASEMDTLTQMSGDYYWYIDRWRQLHFGARQTRPGAFPIQSVDDVAKASGSLLYLPQVTVTTSADVLRNEQIIQNASNLVSPPTELKTADGSTTSWTVGYPIYSQPTILINNSPATVGIQGIDNSRQLYWQPGSASISYDSSLPKLPSGTIISITYIGQSTVNVVLDSSSAQTAQTLIEGGGILPSSGIITEIEDAYTFVGNTTTSGISGMSVAQATTLGNGMLARYGNNRPVELVGTTLYGGLVPGTVIQAFVPEMGVWNLSLPIVKLTTTAFQSNNGIVYFYSVDATNGANISNWQKVFY